MICFVNEYNNQIAFPKMFTHLFAYTQFYMIILADIPLR